METFRWAYVGCGSIAAKTAREITSGAHLIAAVYSRNREKAAAFAKSCGAVCFDSMEELLAFGQFDAVYIATPHTSHVRYAVAAMLAGYPTLCEKPAGVSADEAELLIAAARDRNVSFCEAMWTWFSDVALQVRQWISDGRVGEIKKVRMEYSFPGLLLGRESRLLRPETAGGVLLDVGVYPIAYCLRLFGYPEEIRCRGKLRGGVDVSETVTLRYRGFDCVLKASLTRMRDRCEIRGAKGVIRVPSFFAADRARLKTAEGKEIFRGRTDYRTEFTRVAEEIRRGEKESAYVPLELTRDCLRVADECRRQLGLVYPFEK